MHTDLPAGAPQRTRPWAGMTGWQCHLALLGAVLAALLILTAGDAVAMVAAWARTGAFHHCFLIPPIIAWLIWQRRAALAVLAPQYSLAGCALVGLGILFWTAGAAAYLALLRQAGLVVAVIGLVVALLGRPAARTIRFPLLYALFLIPVGSEIEPLLQTVTARIAVGLLSVSGVAADLQGVFIRTPAGLFRVAEACSGTGFLLAMAAYATLVCHLHIRRTPRRLLFVAVALCVALAVNGLRAYGIMLAANLGGIDHPLVVDHVLYGWLLFAVALGLLTWAVSPWFDDDMDNRSKAPVIVAKPARAGTVLPLLALIFLLSPLWLGVSDKPTGVVSPPPVPPAVRDWSLVAEPTNWRPHFVGATWIGQWRYADPAGRRVDFAIIIFDRQREGQELVGFGQGAVSPQGDWAIASEAPSLARASADWLRGPAGTRRYVTTSYLIDGTVTGSELVAKFASLRARLLDGDPRARAVLLSAEGEDGPQSVALFLEGANSMQEMADQAHPMR